VTAPAGGTEVKEIAWAILGGCELVDGDPEAVVGGCELVDGDPEAVVGGCELVDGDPEAGVDVGELVDGDVGVSWSEIGYTAAAGWLARPGW